MKKDYTVSIIENLLLLYDYEYFNNNVFKARAYKKVLDNIEILTTPINTLEDFQKIEGVGVKIKDKIKELIETNKIEEVE